MTKDLTISNKDKINKEEDRKKSNKNKKADKVKCKRKK